MPTELFSIASFQAKKGWKPEPFTDQKQEVSFPAGSYNARHQAPFTAALRNGLAPRDIPLLYRLRRLPKGYTEDRLRSDLKEISEKALKTNPSWKPSTNPVTHLRLTPPLIGEGPRSSRGMWSCVIAFSDPQSATILTKLLQKQNFIGPDGKPHLITVEPSNVEMLPNKCGHRKPDIPSYRRTSTMIEDTPVYQRFLEMLKVPEVSIWGTLSFGDLKRYQAHPSEHPDANLGPLAQHGPSNKMNAPTSLVQELIDRQSTTGWNMNDKGDRCLPGKKPMTKQKKKTEKMTTSAPNTNQSRRRRGRGRGSGSDANAIKPGDLPVGRKEKRGSNKEKKTGGAGATPAVTPTKVLSKRSAPTPQETPQGTCNTIAEPTTAKATATAKSKKRNTRKRNKNKKEGAGGSKPTGTNGSGKANSGANRQADKKTAGGPSAAVMKPSMIMRRPNTPGGDAS